ncbi:MAG TPA: sugar ABC transporter substrate-binding protein [Thermoanaerobaculia bacterium]|nr:sugar ABC transporter substrate-binding protein [Thermoanaerobaculia bacterium]
MARLLPKLIGCTAAVVIPLALAGCAAAREERVTVRLWGLGREGEVVRDLVPEFERRNPGVHLVVQQIPWTSAHEKLLTAFVGRATPDLAQLGNTWIPEFAAIGALEPLEESLARSASVSSRGYFPGVWETSLYDGAVYGIPWYVDTRVLYYRPDLLARAGFPDAPRTWSEWLDAMRKVKRIQPSSGHPILLPTNEWEQLAILGLQKGSPLLVENGTRGAFSGPEFRAAAEFYVGIYREGLAPIVSYSQLGNAYQEFARGNIAMWMTGPWNLGEFRRRLPPAEQELWMTAALPAPDGTPWPGASFSGGSSLAVFRGSRSKAEAWKVIEFLSEPAVQARFYALSGDLPASRAAWDDPSLAGDEKARAFRVQVERVVAMPRVPEWEQIAQHMAERLEAAIRGRESLTRALAAIDEDVDRILEKRRWMITRRRGAKSGA